MKKSIYLLALMLVLIPAIASAQFGIGVPTEGSTLGDWDKANSIAIQGDYAYVTDGEVGLHVVDITNPDNLVAVGVFGTPGHTRKVVVEGDYAYVANVAKGLQIVDITDPQSPVMVSGIQINSGVNDIAIDGNFAYISGEKGSLDIVDILDPTKPRHISSVIGFGAISSIKVVGDYAYLSGRYTDHGAETQVSVRIVNVSDPASPKQTSELFFGSPDVAVDLDIVDGFIYIGYGTDLMVVDVRAAELPIELFSARTSMDITDIMIKGDHAFVTTTDGLHVFNISNRVQPFLAARYETPSLLDEGAEVAVRGDYAYISDAHWGLIMVDVSALVNEDVDPNAGNAMNVRPDDIAVLRVATLKAYPNPFNPLLTAAVNLPDQSELRISLFNQLGQEVAVLANGNYAAGEQRFALDASKMATGNYYLRAVGTGGLNEVQRVTLMK